MLFASLPLPLQQAFFLLTDWSLGAQLFLVLLATLLSLALATRVHKRLYRRALLTAAPWDDAVLAAVASPLRALILLAGASAALVLANLQLPDDHVLRLLTRGRNIGFIGIVSWFLFLLVNRYADAFVQWRAASGDPADPTTVHALRNLSKALVLIVGSLIILQDMGFSVSGVLAFGGIGGVAVGFAAKDLLANFFGGLIIYLDRPFSVGDWIRTTDHKIEGTVEKVGWRMTVIRTFERHPIYVPNSTFASSPVENPSRMTHRRIRETVAIRYCDARVAKAIARDIRALLAAHPDIDPSQALIVNLAAFGPSSLDILMQAFTRSTDSESFYRVKEDVLFGIHAVITRHGADFAYPTSTVHIVEEVPNGAAVDPTDQPDQTGRSRVA